MKTTTAALLNFLNSLRPTSDASFVMADLFTITLSTGTVLTYTDFDVPVVWNGYTYACDSIMISGLRYKSTIGLDVDTQHISIFANRLDRIGGVPFLQALQQGLFDGAYIQRERAFFTTSAGVLQALTPIGTVLLFKGRVAQIDSIGRTTAQVTVVSDLILLDVDMPRNTYQTNCQNVFCDSRCGLSRAAYTVVGTVAAGSTRTNILWTSATSAFQQGAIAFTSGANAGVEATIKAASAGSLTLAYPLPYAPAAGDAFSAFKGCDHTTAGCAAYGNLANFNGYPYIPPPQIVTGPQSSTYVTGGGK